MISLIYAVSQNGVIGDKGQLPWHVPSDLKHFKAVTLVAMTGYGNDSDVKRSQDAGFDHHLVKPPDFDKLNKLLSTAAEKLN